MVNLYGKEFKLYYLDTCALSNLVKDRPGFGSNLLNLVFEDGIIAIALNSIWELKSSPALYKDVIEVISSIPTVILKTEELIFEEEYKNFKNPDYIISPIILHFAPELYKKNGIDLLKIFEEKVTDAKNELVRKARQEVFDFLNRKHSNIFKREDLKKKSTIEYDVQLAAFQLAVGYIKKDIEQYLKVENKEFPVLSFPSLMSIAYIRHYKYFQAERKGSVSDIEDILMSALYPYVDVVVTERNQCEIIKQIQKRHNSLANLKCVSINQVRLEKYE